MRRHAAFDVPINVFQHHDGIVDHEADRYRERHQGQVIEAVAYVIHSRGGTENRKRDCDAWNDGGRNVKQEDEDHNYHEHYGKDERELHVDDRSAYRLSTIRDCSNLDRRWDCILDARHGLPDSVDRVDNVSARLLVDAE